SDAMGQSRIERFYGYVETKEGDLGEQLVRNGLARIYGFKAAPPGIRSSRVEAEKLQQFENQARQEKIGAWRINMGRLNVSPESPSAFGSFVPSEQHLAPFVSSPTLLSTPKPTRAVRPGDRAHSSSSHAKDKTPLGKIDINTATEK